MTNLLFTDMRQRMIDLYNQEQYEAAYNVLVEQGPQFPDQNSQIVYWQACLTARMGQADLAEDHLADADRLGYWYATNYLRGDDDLKILEGRPRYEQLVESLLARHAKIQAETKPDLTILEPSHQQVTASTPLLMGLHGNNSNMVDTRDQWCPAADLGWLVAVPQSSQIVAKNGYVWNDYNLARQEIEAHIRAIKNKYGLENPPLIFGGFSMGGGLAAWLALSNLIPADGFISIAGFIPDLERAFAGYQGQKMRAVILVGDQDPVCYPQAQQFAERLDHLAIPYQMKVYPGMAHVYPPDMSSELKKALEFILS